jgi:hypothetical protein
MSVILCKTFITLVVINVIKRLIVRTSKKVSEAKKKSEGYPPKTVIRLSVFFYVEK